MANQSYVPARWVTVAKSDTVNQPISSLRCETLGTAICTFDDGTGALYQVTFTMAVGEKIDGRIVRVGASSTGTFQGALY